MSTEKQSEVNTDSLDESKTETPNTVGTPDRVANTSHIINIVLQQGDKFDPFSYKHTSGISRSTGSRIR